MVLRIVKDERFVTLSRILLDLIFGIPRFLRWSACIVAHKADKEIVPAAVAAITTEATKQLIGQRVGLQAWLTR